MNHVNNQQKENSNKNTSLSQQLYYCRPGPGALAGIDCRLIQQQHPNHTAATLPVSRATATLAVGATDGILAKRKVNTSGPVHVGKCEVRLLLLRHGPRVSTATLERYDYDIDMRRAQIFFIS